MTFGKNKTPGAFRIMESELGDGYGTCVDCKGVYFYEGAKQVREGLGSRVPRVISETQRLIDAKNFRDRELLQKHLRYRFFDQATHCTCNPANDQLFLQTRIHETFAQLPKHQDVSADLKILDDLLNRGVLTRDQYEAAKRKMLY